MLALSNVNVVNDGGRVRMRNSVIMVRKYN